MRHTYTCVSSPNVLSYWCANKDACVTLRPIEKGEQLFINYIGVDADDLTTSERHSKWRQPNKQLTKSLTVHNIEQPVPDSLRILLSMRSIVDQHPAFSMQI